MDLTFMCSGRAMISFFLCMIVARLDCLPLALIRQKGEKDIKLSHPSLSKFLINLPCHVNHTDEACVLYLGRAREEGKTIQQYVLKCTCKSRSGSVLKICPNRMFFAGSRLACVEEKDNLKYLLGQVCNNSLKYRQKWILKEKSLWKERGAGTRSEGVLEAGGLA